MRRFFTGMKTYSFTAQDILDVLGALPRLGTWKTDAAVGVSCNRLSIKDQTFCVGDFDAAMAERLFNAIGDLIEQWSSSVLVTLGGEEDVLFIGPVGVCLRYGPRGE